MQSSVILDTQLNIAQDKLYKTINRVSSKVQNVLFFIHVIRVHSRNHHNHTFVSPHSWCLSSRSCRKQVKWGTRKKITSNSSINASGYQVPCSFNEPATHARAKVFSWHDISNLPTSQYKNYRKNSGPGFQFHLKIILMRKFYMHNSSNVE